jgi:hypothetical protein
MSHGPVEVGHVLPFSVLKCKPSKWNFCLVHTWLTLYPENGGTTLIIEFASIILNHNCNSCKVV